MVLPLIPIVLGASALASAAAGLKKSWDAKQNFSSAEQRIRQAKNEWREAAEALELRREEVCRELNLLAELRLNITSKSLSRFAHLFDQVSSSDFDEIMVEGHDVPVEVVPMQDIEKASYEATEFLKHGVQSAVSGAMVGAGMGQAVGMFGAASTGAAISGLSGAAATNATLAWLGGGSLASGGLGMAGGTAVLGGVVAGPILLVMGYLAAGKSEQALTQACAHSAQLDEAVEHLGNASVVLDALDLRARELAWVLEALDERFKAAADRVSRMLGRARRAREASYTDAGKAIPVSLASRKVAYAQLSEKDQASFHLMIALGSALYNAAKLEILDKKGSVTKKSEKFIAEMNELLESV